MQTGIYINIATDSIKALPGNSSVNMYESATIEK
jgi:hypothetical protein